MGCSSSQPAFSKRTDDDDTARVSCLCENTGGPYVGSPYDERIKLADAQWEKRLTQSSLGDDDSATELHFAAQRGDLDAVTECMASGILVNVCDSQHLTPLHYAASRGHLEIMCLLTEAKADVMHIPNDLDANSPLHMATQSGHRDASEMLLDSRAEVGSLNRQKNTPLHLACLKGHVQVVALLLERHGNVNSVNHYGYSPLACAQDWGGPQVADLIVRAGGTR